MSADIFYTGGTGHDHCQDYACIRQKTSDGLHIVAVSDGCSSAPLSHVGAMLLAHAATMESGRFYHLITQADVLFDDILGYFIGALVDTAKTWGIPSSALTATLLLMHEYSDGVGVLMMGDGVIYGKRRDGGATFIQREFKSGAPYYPIYHQSDDILREYKNTFGCTSNITEQIIYEPNNILRSKTTGQETDDIAVSHFFLRDEYESVTVCTDGVLSFQPNQNTADFLYDITSFKSTAGCFLDRRVKRILKDFSRDGITHFDDIGMGTILL